jgi:hypothetical protein
VSFVVVLSVGMALAGFPSKGSHVVSSRTCNPPLLSCVDVSSGLVFWMPFDTSTTSGATTNDLTATPANGTLTGTGNSIGAGQIQQALVNNGTNPYVSIGNVSKLNFANGNGGTPFSLSAWIYREIDSGANMIVFSKGYNGTFTQWQLSVNTSTLTMFCGGYSGGSTHGVTSVSTSVADTMEFLDMYIRWCWQLQNLQERCAR